MPADAIVQSIGDTWIVNIIIIIHKHWIVNINQMLPFNMFQIRGIYYINVLRMTHLVKFIITQQFYSTKVGVNWLVKIIDVEVKCIYHIVLKNGNPWILTLLVISWLRHTTQYTHKCDAIIYSVLICNITVA